jgi:hypothetical protein
LLIFLNVNTWARACIIVGGIRSHSSVLVAPPPPPPIAMPTPSITIGATTVDATLDLKKKYFGN